MDRLTFAFWRSHGLSVRAANLLCQHHCSSLDDVRRLGSAEIFRLFGLGPRSYNEIAKLVEWPQISRSTDKSKLRDLAAPEDPSPHDAEIALAVDIVMAQMKA